MAFDEKAFTKARFEARTETVEIAALAAFFPEGEKPAFTVRGLTGAEFARVQEAVSKNANLDALVKALAQQVDAEKLRELLGLATTKQPAEIVKRLQMLESGAVEPKLSLPACIKLAEAFPIDFYDLTARITRLTGQGMVPGKPTPSGDEQTSGQP